VALCCHPIGLDQPEATADTLTGFLPETYVEGFHDPHLVKMMKYRRLGACKNKYGKPMHISILSFGASSLGGAHRKEVVARPGGCKVVVWGRY